MKEMEKFVRLYREKKYEQCLVALRAFIAKYPNETSALGYAGLCYLDLERPSEAVPYFDRCLEEKAGSNHFWVLRGDCYYDQGDFAQAMHDYSISLALEPENWAVYDKIGHCHHFLGQGERGIAWVEYAFERGRQPDTMLILSMLLEENGRLDEALARARAGAREFPHDNRFRERLQELKRIPRSREDSKRKPEK
jgi:tetratricopeptide (TPR) repeat protein